VPAGTRAALLQELAGVVDAASAGAGRVLIVSGEAGIGKTTLVRTLSDRRRERVLWGSCEPLTTSRPLLPLRDWAAVLGGEISAALAAGDPRFDLFAAVLAEAGRVPTLAVVEDVHWADDSTLDLLVFLGRRLGPLPLSLVLTARDDQPVAPRCAEVLALLGALPNATRVSVPHLTTEEVAAITAGSGLDAPHVRRITGGNAFFVTQLVGAPTEGVPRSVREAVLARVSTLPDAGRILVETVAVIPDRADLASVYAAAPAGPADLDLAERAGLLVSDGRTVEFRHELAREAVEGALPGARRRQRHQAVFGALLARGRRDSHLLAYHADRAGQSGPAVEFGLRAAEQSALAGSHRQAVVQLERARSHLDSVEPGLALRVLHLLVAQYQLTGPIETAAARAAEAVACARGTGDPELLASALAGLARTEWMAGHRDEAQAALAEAHDAALPVPGTAGELAVLTQTARLSMLGRHLRAAVEVGSRAIELADVLGDRASRLAAVNSVGTAMLLDDPDGGQKLLTDGITLARRLGEDGHAALLMANLGSMSGEYRRYEVAITWLQRCAEFCQERDVDLTRDFATSWLARIAFERGDWNRAVELGTALLDSPDVPGRMIVSTLLGRIAVHRADRAAGELLGQAWDLTERGGDTQRMWPAAAGLAEAAWADERADPPPQVQRVFADAAELGMSWAVGELGWWLVRFGVISRDDPRLAAAAAPFAAQIRGDWPAAARQWTELGCRLEAAQARAETDDPGALRQAIAVLDELGARAAADRAAARLRRLGGGRVRRARRATAANPFQLTARELEVLELLREGLTNAEIAQRTYTSAKTVGHHVSAILAKLDVPSRREAVRAAGALRAAGGPAGPPGLSDRSTGRAPRPR
jgi:DNA-binding CsgD family transcriptional regulator/tetratricopeptide (TPR) repeat protein